MELSSYPNRSRNEHWVQSIDSHGGLLVASKELNKNMDDFQRFFNTVEEFLFILDLKGRVLHCNTEFTRCLGYSTEEMLQMNVTELFSTDCKDEIIEILDSILKGTMTESRIPLQTRAGHLIPVDTKLSVGSWNSEDALYGVSRDVTERTRVEKELRESQHRFNILTDNVRDVIWVVDMNLQFTYFSSSVKEMFGYTVEEALAKSIDAVLTEESIETIAKEYAEALATDNPETTIVGSDPSIEVEMIHKDGSRMWVDLSRSFLRNNDGSPNGIMGVARNITGRKRVEAALQESEAKLRLIGENTPGHLVLHSPSGEVLACNRPPSDMAVEEFIGKSIYDMNPPRYHDVVAASFKRVIMTGESDVYFTEYEHKDGHIVSVEVRLGAIKKDGKVVSILSSSYDITEQKRSREELERLVEERTKELENAQEQLVKSERLAVLGKLSGGIAHEIRNPLGTMKNSIYYLRMILDESLNEITGTLDILDSAIASTESIVKSLLDYAQPGKRMLKKANINDIIISSLSHVGIPEGIIVSKMIDSKLPDIVADPNQIESVIVNLCVNAIQAMTDGGTLTIKTEVAEPGWLEISIIDTGTGMDEETREHLFEPLYTTKAKGIGLGLPIANLHTKAHGGSIEVRSTLGKGATFIVKLPYIKKNEK